MKKKTIFGNDNSNDYQYLAFLVHNGEGTVEEHSEKNWSR